ncbi:putative acid phosphatase [Aspergillus campestris IBT 28561]|uniref:Acid phosphatase n=1 Tax=Aspergillus campestris (strain IBT 28561) TaxID=1392248 RepID=A0A2I1D723_ASPC2|nr:putative acid phosphatase [Aspergillus campestris IBT 28561]PKY05668.1 putative acid phosphatase [Aspergillus campestris IBT 28561]
MLPKSLLTLVGGLSLALAAPTCKKRLSNGGEGGNGGDGGGKDDPFSPVSNVKGLAFNRFVQVWMENTDYEDAFKNKDFAELAKEGLLLTNFYALTHPSMPNYMGAAGGDTFGLDNDEDLSVPANISTIADMFDTKQIAWGEYQEDMPHVGFQDEDYQNDGKDDYVRKHNPLIMFESVTKDETRLRQIKNFKHLDDDLQQKRLPQFSFITPNMTNDAHDAELDEAAGWVTGFLKNLLQNEYFSTDTLVMLTFDENDNTDIGNQVYTLLLGGAVPQEMRGQTDDTFYTHYSTIASLAANWGLPSLGRWDCGANLLNLVAQKTGYVNWKVESTKKLMLSETNEGPLSREDGGHFSGEWPAPLTEAQCSAGHGILPVVQKTWSGHKPTFNYLSPVPHDSKNDINIGVSYSRTRNGAQESGITK